MTSRPTRQEGEPPGKKKGGDAPEAGVLAARRHVVGPRVVGVGDPEGRRGGVGLNQIDVFGC